MPTEKRGGALSVLATFWMIGNIAVAGLAWAIIPHTLGWNNPDGFKYNSWRIFVAVASLPSFLVSLGLATLPKSPKFLLYQGKQNEALSILQKIYSQNTGRPKVSYPVKQFETVEVDENTKVSWCSAVSDAAQKAGQLFSPSLIKVMVVMLIINFAIQFGYYGLWLWFPDIFSKLEEYYKIYPNETVTVCQVRFDLLSQV